MAVVKSGWLHRQSEQTLKLSICKLAVKQHIKKICMQKHDLINNNNNKNCNVYFEGTILRRWKRNWFDLWADGRLVFYNDQQRRDMEDDIHMRVHCINIRGSAACQGIVTCFVLAH